MAKLEAGMTREQAFALLQEHNKDPFHIEHGETVEQTMRYFAREFDPENEEFWGIVGLLHGPGLGRARRRTRAAHGLRRQGHRGRRRHARARPRHPKPHVRLQPRAAQARTADGEDPVRHRGADRPHRRRHRHAPEQERHGLRGEVAQEEVQGQALRRRREPRRHPLRCRHARLGAGRAVRPHHRGHAVLRSRSRHLSSLRKRSPASVWTPLASHDKGAGEPYLPPSRFRMVPCFLLTTR